MKDAKREKVMVPYPLTDKDKADMADELLEHKQEKDEREANKAEYLKNFNEKIKEIDGKMDYQFAALKNGTKPVEEECRVRKNFELNPPMIEYVHLKKDEVLHAIEMPAEAYQTEVDDWIVGEVKPVPPAESLQDEE